MKKIISLSISAIAVMVLTTGCVSEHENMEHEKAEHTKSHTTHWGYTGDVAPEHWAELDEKFSMCGKGKMQTPINIVPTEDIDIKPLGFHYNTSATTVINNGHTVQVNIASGSTVTIDGEEYELKQFHFHTPSENNIKGTEFPLEAHFVHATKNGDLAVVAVMFKDGAADPMIAKIWSKFPLDENKPVSIDLSKADINQILPSDKDYYKFMGSLTTPPCSENVKWNVFKTTKTISKDQVKQFYDIFGHTNNRPIQDTNHRTIAE